MQQQTPAPSKREVSIVLATTALLSFASVSRATALALADLGIAAFFVSGTTVAHLGVAAPCFVLAAVLAGLLFRAVDIESWALFIPGGLPGRVREAFGQRSAATAAAAVLLERLLFAALACTVAGHYVVELTLGVIGGVKLPRHVTPGDVSTLLAVLLLGIHWLRARLGYHANTDRAVRQVWVAVGALALLVLWSLATLAVRPEALQLLAAPARDAVASGMSEWQEQGEPGLAALLVLAFVFVGLGHSLPAVGSGESLGRVVGELEPPRIRGLRRTTFIVGAYAVLITASTSFFFGALVPESDQPRWLDAPLAGLAQHVAGPAWLRLVLTATVAIAAVLILAAAARSGLSGAERTLSRLAHQHAMPQALARPHPRFGTLDRVIDTVAAAAVLAIVASGGRVAWLAGAYAVGLVWTLAFKVAALTRLRARRPVPSFQAPFNLRIGSHEWPVGLWVIGAGLAASGLALLATGNGATFAGTGALIGVAAMLAIGSRRADLAQETEEPETFQLLPSTDLSLEHVEARPDGLLVAVRNTHALAHVNAALQAAGDRDVVVMTARLLGFDAEDEGANDPHPTAAERTLFSQVLAIAESLGRPVRLLIVPARSVPDAVVDAVLRLKSSDVYVGESATLSADTQARLLGEAWERAAKTEPQKVRLVVHHRSGRTEVYHLGAHAPALTPRDLDLIHTLWLDAVKAVGTNVHHHDVVRAALMQMAQQMNGPDRDEALKAIQQSAKPADQLAAVVRSRDFSQLRDIVRNRPPSDLAALLSELGIEDQVVVFRLLPRKDAAATFEYLSREVQEALLKAMAQEDVASLLNNMAPDDRTMFLEELPATVTRQLLALLTPKERSVALTLLGYPEDSIGRLMTPHYVAVREDWTVQQVLDFIRAHGQDSETLNVIYVVDESGLLIDDIRIRELLLTSPTNRVADLMDRRFVALRATDDQKTAVALFKQHDRSALPVTDTAGMLIGIVTVDDVLDVAEAAATQEIQRIGGSEALEEPYMLTAFGRMVRKRAGWLTALFLGEMLTATAMGAFEREIERAVVLALFVPLIISSGGNSGSQASTLVIRALALGEVGLRDWWRVMRREVAAGLALGTILGGIGFLRITLWSAFSDIYGPHWLLVACTVSVALIGIVLWGTLVGSLLPFLLRRLGFDPATSSAPFVATLVDVTGLVIYFTVGIVILRGTLL